MCRHGQSAAALDLPSGLPFGKVVEAMKMNNTSCCFTRHRFTKEPMRKPLYGLHALVRDKYATKIIQPFENLIQYVHLPGILLYLLCRHMARQLSMHCQSLRSC